jgi:voltage-dependent potassium channel beta subunit
VKYRNLGRSGLKLSEISLGAWVTFGSQVEDSVASDLLHAAYEMGINFFDNADVYAGGEAELVMGKAIADLPRQSLVISSKVFWQTFDGVNGRGLSRKHIMESCHASLKRLGTEYLDLYFCHRYDPETPLEEVVRAMDDLVRQGKVMYWGTSEWSAAQIADAYEIAGHWGSYAPAAEQPHYNMLVRQRVEQELAPGADEYGYGLVTWSPLRSGLLSGKYNSTQPSDARLTLEKYSFLHGILTEESLEKARQLGAVAEDLGVSLAQLAIGWLLRIPQVSSVITGATRLEQLKENAGAIALSEHLSQEVLERIETILGTDPIPEPS